MEPKHVSRIFFRPAIVMFGDAFEYIGHNKAADVFEVIHDSVHFVTVTKRATGYTVHVPMTNVNCLEYLDQPGVTKLEDEKLAKQAAKAAKIESIKIVESINDIVTSVVLKSPRKASRKSKSNT